MGKALANDITYRLGGLRVILIRSVRCQGSPLRSDLLTQAKALDFLTPLHFYRCLETVKSKKPSLKNVRFTDKEIVKIEVQGKGGYVRDINVSADTYRHLESHIKENGIFKVDKDAYRADLKSAAA